jgi:hypothetical protein
MGSILLSSWLRSTQGNKRKYSSVEVMNYRGLLFYKTEVVGDLGDFVKTTRIGAELFRIIQAGSSPANLARGLCDVGLARLMANSTPLIRR